jgi:hypothetical protein
VITCYGICRGQQASGFNPTAGEFVPGGFAPPAAEAAPAPAAEAKEETWESAPNAEPAAAPAAKAPEEEMEKLDVNDEELKKELAAMKAEGLLDDEEEAEITTGKKAPVRLLPHFSHRHRSARARTHTHTHTHYPLVLPFVRPWCWRTCANN